jgi:mannose-6-phosphate isomerase-like protein (cupin superfamily)
MSMNPQRPPVLAMRNWQVEVHVDSAHTDLALCVLLHTLEPGLVAMPMHRNLNATTVLQALEGTLSVKLGDRVVELRPGDDPLAIPRGSWHTFWNSSGRPVRFQETAAPGGLERYYEALAPLIPRGGRPDVEAVFALSDPHGLEFDVDSLVDIIERHHVRLT